MFLSKIATPKFRLMLILLSFLRQMLILRRHCMYFPKSNRKTIILTQAYITQFPKQHVYVEQELYVFSQVKSQNHNFDLGLSHWIRNQRALSAPQNRLGGVEHTQQCDVFCGKAIERGKSQRDHLHGPHLTSLRPFSNGPRGSVQSGRAALIQCPRQHSWRSIPECLAAFC